MVAARKRQQNRSRAIAGGFLALVLIAGVAVLVNPADDDQEVASTGPTTTTIAGAPTTVAKKPVELPPGAPGLTVKGDTPCPPTDGSAQRTTTFEKPPPLCVAVAKTYTAEIDTSKGLMVANLDVKTATKTVNNFVVLARYKYFDGTLSTGCCPASWPRADRAGSPTTAAGARATTARTSRSPPTATPMATWPWPGPKPSPAASSSSSFPEAANSSRTCTRASAG